ncbi:MAG TPA: EamA family transporter RarD [Albitalea sp.]|nr:EamA family transporter RarD [Albitalea sp.]
MNPGLVYAALAYALWGLFPLYFHLVASVPSFEIVVHRCAWALLVLVVALSLMRRWSWLPGMLRQPRKLALFALSALLLSANWMVYVWAVNHERVIDASLGYFITPLVNVLLGYLVLHERLRRAQVAAVALAAFGVLWLALQAGQLPWIGLVLAASFGCYGLMRKTAPLGALEGLALETLLLAPLVLPLLVWSTLRGSGVLLHGDTPLIGWLLLSGPLTVVPLLLFAAGARRITMATLGLLQYIGPTIQFALGVWLYHEPFGGTRLAGFALIWLALALYSAESWWVSQRRAAEPALSTV